MFRSLIDIFRTRKGRKREIINLLKKTSDGGSEKSRISGIFYPVFSLSPLHTVTKCIILTKRYLHQLQKLLLLFSDVVPINYLF